MMRQSLVDGVEGGNWEVCTCLGLSEPASGYPKAGVVERTRQHERASA